MSFVLRLRPELIAVAPPWHSFRETVEGLVDRLVTAGAIPADGASAAVRAVIAREAEASTAVLEIGVGVPHARLAGMTMPAVALAVSGQGLYEAVPTVPINVVALVLSPPNASDAHLRILAGIATLLRSGELRAAMFRAQDPAAVLAALTQHERSAP
jgi:mannitol/fructose-specific phosphotransferase system IIA component (Ntr-type)